jgi:hypothetical protein
LTFFLLQSLTWPLRSQFEQATWHLLKSLMRSFDKLACQGGKKRGMLRSDGFLREDASILGGKLH